MPFESMFTKNAFLIFIIPSKWQSCSRKCLCSVCPQRISIGVPSEVVNFFCKGLDNKYFRPLQARWILSKLLSSTIIAQKQPKTILNKWKKWMSKVLFPWNLIYKNRGGPDLACGCSLHTPLIWMVVHTN